MTPRHALRACGPILIAAGLSALLRADPVSAGSHSIVQLKADGISLSRPQWLWSSLPLDGSGSARLPLLSEHALIQWYNPRGVLERDFNPVLTREEGSDNQRTVLEMNVLAPSDSAAGFGTSVWAGLAQSISRLGADLSSARLVNIWVNDMTPISADSRPAAGRKPAESSFCAESRFSGAPAYPARQPRIIR